MGKKVLIRAAVGFSLGALVAVILGVIDMRFCSQALAARVGSEGLGIALQILGSGLYGSACMVGTLFYDFERWSLALATALHYLIIAVGLALCYWLLCWGMGAGLLLTVLAGQTAGFFLIWLIMWLRYRKEVKELNELNGKKQALRA